MCKISVIEIERIKFLRGDIERHEKLYNKPTPTPEITDTDFDKIYNELIDLEQKYPEMFDENSPTQKIYEIVLKGLKKVKHPAQMQSLEKSKTEKDLRKFFIRIKGGKIIIQLKLDGLTIVLKYKNGVFYQGVTRGESGKIGQDVTHTVRTIKNIPKRIDFDGEFEVRSEVLMPYAEFERINVDGAFTSPRNLASGSIITLDASKANERGLSAICYDILVSEGKEFKDDLERLEFMKTLGFDVVPYMVFENTNEGQDEMVKFCLEYNDTQRSSLSYMIDGLVLKVNDLKERIQLGQTNKYPKWGLAFKFPSEDAITKLLGVEWTVGKTGQLTPNAIIDPVEVGGVTVSRASLANSDNIELRDIRVGDWIRVARSNDVIPQVISSEKERRTGEEIIIEIPKVCPDCGGIVERELVHYFCRNLQCPAQEERRLEHFVARNTMNIDTLGEKTVELFYEKKLLANIPDIYRLKDKVDEISKLDKMGAKKISNMLNAIEDSKTASLNKVLYGLAIKNIGDNGSTILANKYRSMDNIIEASKDIAKFKNELLSLNDFGDGCSDSVVAYFTNPEKLDIVLQLKGFGLTMIQEVDENVVIVENPFMGKIVVATGSLEHYTRDSIKVKLEALGCKVSKSVSKKTDYVLVGSDAGGKYDKAVELGVKTISETEFEAMIK